MKKILVILALYLGVTFATLVLNISAASTEYTTFSEVMMPQGKLLINFTEDEINQMFKKVEKPTFMGVNVYKENSNIDASYISNTLYSVENRSLTDVIYEIKVEVETTNKVSFSANGSLSGSASGTIQGVKGEIGTKCGVEVSNTTTASRVEKQTMEIKVEANSRAIVYLTGSLSVTNGAAAIYYSFIQVAKGGFEIVTLKNQYARVEKVSI